MGTQRNFVSTLAPSLEANKNAPLNFLFRLYVSHGGGVSLLCDITGICDLMCAV